MYTKMAILVDNAEGVTASALSDWLLEPSVDMGIDRMKSRRRS